MKKPKKSVDSVLKDNKPFLFRCAKKSTGPWATAALFRAEIPVEASQNVLGRAIKNLLAKYPKIKYMAAPAKAGYKLDGQRKAMRDRDAQLTPTERMRLAELCLADARRSVVVRQVAELREEAFEQLRRAMEQHLGDGELLAAGKVLLKSLAMDTRLRRVRSTLRRNAELPMLIGSYTRNAEWLTSGRKFFRKMGRRKASRFTLDERKVFEAGLTKRFKEMCYERRDVPVRTLVESAAGGLIEVWTVSRPNRSISRLERAIRAAKREARNARRRKGAR